MFIATLDIVPGFEWIISTLYIVFGRAEYSRRVHPLSYFLCFLYYYYY